MGLQQQLIVLVVPLPLGLHLSPLWPSIIINGSYTNDQPCEVLGLFKSASGHGPFKCFMVLALSCVFITNVGRNTTSVELARKTLADLHCKFFGNTEQKNFLYRKQILSASVCKKNCAMSAEKYQSGLYNDRCQVLFFKFNP